MTPNIIYRPIHFLVWDIKVHNPLTHLDMTDFDWIIDERIVERSLEEEVIVFEINMAT